MFNHFPVIRLYAPGDSGGAAAGDDDQDQNQNPDGDPKGDPEKDDPPKVPTLKELLKDKDFASELDQHVSKAINTAQTKWEKEQKLTEAQRAEKRQEEQDAALSKREADLAARELKADMVTEIGKRTLPAALIDAVSLTGDKDAAMASLDKVEKAFRTAVDDAVKEKLKGNPPPDGGGAGGTSFLQNFRAASGLKEPTK